MNRREFITLLGGAAAAWPLAARAQQPERTRRIGVLMGFAQSDPQWNAYVAAFRAALQELGWSDGRNVLIDTRWTNADPDPSAAAAELVALSPDAIFACPHTPTAALHRQTRTIPIVAAISGDPVSAGFVQSHARPGGNVTVFLIFETAINTKYPQLLKDIAPHVTRAAVVHAENTSWREDFATVKTAAQSFKMEAVEIIVRDAADIERKLAEFSRAANGGLILPPDAVTIRHRQLILALAANYRLPALYAVREFVTDGGLMCYSTDFTDIFRRAASYVDRILKGEKASDLPVQAPTKFELIINLKTAKALGLEVPPTMLARADEVIE
jgi:ABC-type uncharacterized transport system substrate-binding protein